ncbi:LCP family protein [Streptomyces sp. NPDC015131]|uniref:LCP family protein n=1 Tax=Streptomyces sp. NPDC015131 TaxID=3364941 RepID=UPI0036F631DD
MHRAQPPGTRRTDDSAGAGWRIGRHRRPRARRRPGARRRVVAVAVVALLSVVAAAGWLLHRLDGNLETVDIDSALGSDRPAAGPDGALNILVLGSDSRAGSNGRYGRDHGGSRSDTAMVVHLSKDRTRADVVSVPRDTMVDRPACRQSDGTTAPARRGMFNEALSTGGPACAVKTVEAMSSVRMDHFVEIDFHGFTQVIDVLGGVDITTTRPIHDPYSHLDLPAGSHHLDGEKALGLVRTRHGVGDGSDLGRIEVQQSFLKALSRQARSSGALSNPSELYRLADITTRNITTDETLGSVQQLVGLARRVKDVDTRRLATVTLPVSPDPADPNRVVPDTRRAAAMWSALGADRPLPRPERPGGGRTGSVVR